MKRSTHKGQRVIGVIGGIEKIRLKYKKYKKERGAEIKKIWRVTRDELFPFIYENADFSLGFNKEFNYGWRAKN